jgi:hypothetical protein
MKPLETKPLWRQEQLLAQHDLERARKIIANATFYVPDNGIRLKDLFGQIQAVAQLLLDIDARLTKLETLPDIL